MRIGIMSAMLEENSLLIEKLLITRQVTCAQRTYTIGSLDENEIVLAFSRWGKVAAAITASHLINEFKVEGIIFTGVAGACSTNLKIGDIVIAENLIQHDMDARPIFSRYEVPLIGVSSFPMNNEWKEKAYHAAKAFLSENFAFFEKKLLQEFGISNPQVYQGRVASGDKFFASQNELRELQTQLPSTLCVEMEGAAVAQVCYEHQIPCTIIRTISDSGNESSPEQFQTFVSAIASRYSLGILENFLPYVTLSPQLM